jgi:GT2 family glycosyltransferase
MDLSIIIVNWRSAVFVRGCLLSLRTAPPRCAVEVIVVDNASFDQCGELLAREFPEVKFLQNDCNLGFARANNLAAQRASGRILLFLNPDTELRPNALDQMLSVFESQPDAGVVGARLLNSDGSIQRTSIQAFPTLLNQYLDSDFLRRCLPRWSLWRARPMEQTNGVHPDVEAISGACLMTPRHVFDLAGGFDDRYFMYAEDTDYCFGVRQLGWKNYYAPEAVVVHHGGKSSGGAHNKFSAVMLNESLRRFFNQRRGALYARVFQLMVMCKAFERLALLTIACPIVLVSGQTSRLYSSRRKWWHILRWSCGLEKAWVQSFETANEPGICRFVN